MLGWFVETTLVASVLAVVAAMGSRLRSIGPTARHAAVAGGPGQADDTAPGLLALGRALGAGLALSRVRPRARRCREDASRRRRLRADHARGPGPEPGLDPSRTTSASRPQRENGSWTIRVKPIPTPRCRPSVLASGAKPDESARLPAAGLGWLFLTVLLGVGQAWRIIRFRGRLRAAVPAPEDLVEEAERIGRCLGVRVPELLVVPDLGTPLLWCLGRPKLLLPAPTGRDARPGPMARDPDPRIGPYPPRRPLGQPARAGCRLDLVVEPRLLAGPHPARCRGRAGLRCLGGLDPPQDRLAYAEALFNICSTLSTAKAPAPALGAAGSGRFFERRLTMILHGHVPCRLSPWLSWPRASWPCSPCPPGRRPSRSRAQPERRLWRPWSRPSIPTSPAPSQTMTTMTTTMTTTTMTVAKAKADLKKAEADSRRPRPTPRRPRPTPRRPRPTPRRPRPTARNKGEVEFDFSKLGETIEKEIEGKFGPEFEKQMEELGEKIEKEIEGKFGPDFEKKMEELGEKIGKEMEAKFGPGSEFEKKMKELGKEMEAKFGPGSEFEKKMKELGKEMETKFGPGSDFEKKIKEQAEKLGSEVQKKAAKKPSAAEDGPRPVPPEGDGKGPVAGKDRQRERRIAGWKPRSANSLKN